MKPLTIEELKALEVGDWVWIIILQDSYRPDDVPYGEYHQIYSTINHYYFVSTKNESLEYKFPYEDYGTKWLAYKNKEQAEAKGEIVETGKYFIEPEQLPNRPLRYLICDYSVSKGVRDMCDTLEEAERRLAELKGEVLQ